MKKIISFLGIILLLTACTNSSKFETITTNKAIELIDNGAIVIDVRTNMEFDSGHIPNAVNIPLDDINNIAYSKDSTIIVYCQSGMRSLEAVKTLSDLGYTSLYNLDGGLLNWGGDLEE